jgi:uncharacterized glyoxalase superfamily protein PhnB
MISSLKAVFDAQEVAGSRIVDDSGLTIHGVLQLRDAKLLLFEARDGCAPTPAFLNIYVQNIEEVHQKAIENGARSVTAITPLWFGEKVCRILDPLGNLIWINQRTEEVDFTDPEIAKRAASPDAMAGIGYIQRSLDDAMRQQRKFFETFTNLV